MKPFPEVNAFSDILCAWYARFGRDLPWRHTRDPYRIWLSEVILQQTRVEQGREYYLRFVGRFPDVGALAAASEEEVLKLWQGLGYYSRARNLHRAARLIAEQYGGRFTERYDEVRALPGVGEYTAAAICSFASDAPLAVLDGNVFRVLARLFDLDLPIDTTQGRRRFAELAASLLPPGRAALHNQAIMDFGALQCTPQQPRCGECPLAEHCLALAAGTVAVRPVKQGRTKVRDRWFAYVVVLCGDELLLHRRDGRDIWRGLYEFPLVERDRPLDAAELPAQEEFAQLTGGAACMWLSSVAMPPHRLSHQLLHATFHRLRVEHLPERLPDGVVRVRAERLDDYAVPRLIERYLTRYPI